MGGRRARSWRTCSGRLPLNQSRRVGRLGGRGGRGGARGAGASRGEWPGAPPQGDIDLKGRRGATLRGPAQSNGTPRPLPGACQIPTPPGNKGGTLTAEPGPGPGRPGCPGGLAEQR